jgi:hypothetical protein
MLDEAAPSFWGRQLRLRPMIPFTIRELVLAAAIVVIFVHTFVMCRILN